MTDNGKPKYFSLMEQLRSDIMSGAIRPGEKLPSENELSQKYSLSRHTVRKALGILEQDGYVEAFHGRGTYCSENMRHIKNSKNIAVVTTYISDYIFPRLIQGMDNVLSESGYCDCEKGIASFDGDTFIPMVTGDCIQIRRADVKTKILKLNHLSFVEVLRRKMRDS